MRTMFLLAVGLATTGCSQWNDVHTSLRERTQEALDATFPRPMAAGVRTAWRGVGGVTGLVCGRANVSAPSGGATLRFIYHDGNRRTWVQYDPVLDSVDPRFARERQYFVETWERECAPTAPAFSSWT